jgi:membrane protein
LYRFIRTLIQRSIGEFLRNDCSQRAAAISYYGLFALFPLLIFIVGITGLFIQSNEVQQDIIDEVLENIPLDEGEGRDTVSEAVEAVAGPESGLLGLLALAGMAWSASGLFGALRKSLNSVFGDSEFKRPFVQQKALDMALLLALAAFFLVSIGATAFMRIVRTRSTELGGLGDAADGTGLLWDAASYAVPLCISFLAFIALYCLVPSRLRSPLEVWPGALLAASFFEFATLTFSFYLEHFSNFDLVFGSLGAAVGLLFWVYVNANIMLFGAAVAAQYPQIPKTGYSQPTLEGLKAPLHQRAWGIVRGLFVRAPAGTRSRAAVLHEIEPADEEPLTRPR